MSSPQARATILVVDDDGDISYLLCRVLEHAGYNAINCSHSDDVLALARSTHPALVLMDVRLDGTSGIELTQELHADPALGGTPVLLFTARVLLAQAVREAGAQGGLIKPFRIAELLASVGAALDVAAQARLGRDAGPS